MKNKHSQINSRPFRSKDEMYKAMAVQLSAKMATNIAVMRSKFISDDSDICYAEGFVQGLKFALHGIGEGKISMKIVEQEPPEPECKVQWKPQQE